MKGYDQWRTTPPKEPRTVRVKIEIIAEFSVDETDGPDTDIEAQCVALADSLVRTPDDVHGANDLSVDSVEVKDWDVVSR